MAETNGPLRRLESWVCALQRFVDVAVVIGAQALAHLSYGEPWNEQTTTATLVGLLVFGLAGEVGGLYRPWRTGTVLREVKNALLAWTTVPLVLFAIWFLTQTTVHYSRVASSAWFVLTPLLLCAVRVGFRVALRLVRIQGRNIRRVAILGCTPDAEKLAESFDTKPWLGLKLLGVYDDRSAERRYVPKHPHCVVVGNSDDMVQACRQGKIDAVYIALPLRAEVRAGQILSALADTTVSVYLVADLLYYSLLHAQWSQIGNVPVVSLHDSPFEGVVGWAKRTEDLALGSLIVVLAFIPLLCIALAIKLKSPGPVLFRQWRYGLCGRRIRILKFRTMTVSEEGAEVVQATKDDPRVTRLGRFLRRTSLDLSLIHISEPTRRTP